MRFAGGEVETIRVDLAIVGSGAAGLMAAIGASREDPALRIAILSKGLIGRSGCSVMVRGFNAALGSDDTPALHFADMVRSGEFLNDQHLAWRVANEAPVVVDDLVKRLGCRFDRLPDGSLHLAAFPGQTRDRDLHRGHDTGLEIMGRLRDAVQRLDIAGLADVRALELLQDDSGTVAGVVAIDIRKGRPLIVLARAVVCAAGGGSASLYRRATAAREKTGDGLALGVKAGAELRDMEMVQFLSVGLSAGGSRLTGTLLGEALRSAGAHLLNGRGERFMERYDPVLMERAPRDVVVRACYAEIIANRGTPERAVILDARPIGAATLNTRFAEFVVRARLAGRDLTMEPVHIAPAAHIGIGGLVIDASAATSVEGLFAAGEDVGGTHGASWQGGNGIAESTTFGLAAGRTAARAARRPSTGTWSPNQVSTALHRAYAPLGRDKGSTPFELIAELQDMMWERAGLVREQAGLVMASEAVSELSERARGVCVPGSPAMNPAWQDALDLGNRLFLAECVIASAQVRQESRGMHVRTDFPERDDAHWLRTIVLRRGPSGLNVGTKPVALPRLKPGDLAPDGSASGGSSYA